MRGLQALTITLGASICAQWVLNVHVELQQGEEALHGGVVGGADPPIEPTRP